MFNINDEEKARIFLEQSKDKRGVVSDRKFTSLWVGRTVFGKSSSINNLKLSYLMTLIASVSALVAIGVINEAALALPRREIYKISDINQFDADNFCRNKYGNYTSARLDREKDVVICGTRQSSQQSQVGTGGANVTVNGEQWTEQSHHLSEICESKHKHKGTWVGDGGRSCYDSYWKW